MKNNKILEKNYAGEITFPKWERNVFCNRTLNLRAIKAIGFDMDYTLVHYNIKEWENRAYEHLKEKLISKKWPIQELKFDPNLFIRGLIIDLKYGNIVKANRFGYVKRAFHGTKLLDFDEQRQKYSRTLVDLSEERWIFLNTLFSHSEACIYAQLVDKLDEGKIPEILNYNDLYTTVRQNLDQTHLEGLLKAEIISKPQNFIAHDPDLPQTLLDLFHSGKKLLLITNSDWNYTKSMMSFILDNFLPNKMKWRDLFDVIIVSASKPDFFTNKMAYFEVVNDDGLLRPSYDGIKSKNVYHGGYAQLIEKYLGVSGEEILYVGDHIFTDVNVSKSIMKWRTALILRELESEIIANEEFLKNEKAIAKMMVEKEKLEWLQSKYRLVIQRLRVENKSDAKKNKKSAENKIMDIRAKLKELDAQIAPIAVKSSDILNSYWGPLMRAGNDKSHLARQIERYADIYTSRVSNFLFITPFAYLRSPRGNMPHDKFDDTFDTDKV